MGRIDATFLFALLSRPLQAFDSSPETSVSSVLQDIPKFVRSRAVGREKKKSASGGVSEGDARAKVAEKEGDEPSPLCLLKRLVKCLYDTRVCTL